MDFTASIRCTWLVYKTRISTCTVTIFDYTCMLALAFSIFFTANVRDDLRYFCTSATIWVPCVAWRACTVSSVIASRAQGIRSTVTWIYTFFISTCLVIWAFRICQTFNLSTYVIRISSISRKASTFRSMSIDGAFCINATFLVYTRVLTLPVNTSLAQWTLIITFAAWLFTNCVRISNISNYASTYGTVVSYFTFCISATGCCVTWVLTFLSDTCKVRWAIRIYHAFRSRCY